MFVKYLYFWRGYIYVKIIQNPGNFILGLILALVFTLDIATTQICLSTGMGHELNPLIAPIVDNPFALILIKAVGLLLVVIVVNYFNKTYPRWIGQFGMSVVIGITLGAVINNLLLIL
jgi:hypothetical protein